MRTPRLLSFAVLLVLGLLAQTQIGAKVDTTDTKLLTQPAISATHIAFIYAGDLYSAGFLYGLTHGAPLAECGRLGSLSAAEAISHIGARPEVSLRKLALENGLVAS